MWWNEFVEAEPEFAERVKARFTAGKHSTMATLRSDGSPRISGTEVVFTDDEGLLLGSMPGSVKARDLLRDPRLALHSPSFDPPEDDPGSWPGDAKISGTAHDVVDPAPEDGSHRFRIDVTEVVLTYVTASGDHLVIESWHRGRGHEQRTRK
ncbi:pyridoxamine 5'-phosphate oxidase family protein [Dactylosporangium fulvum]|uniref:Pyridoxamine 5'-phosphate oxidase family protein n=1 Tax=Dactylosporangium fulvum TaxID=53359 RepID=A0ABY5W620_9ACTN|nr:pyridoxamine 5'-phosphate oxidase family protein [Dactylosporangium fulvum]UWP84909.1 pyridoxamine 5'-phosphate oxidase family protein [Dactylosporangium fulvum]